MRTKAIKKVNSEKRISRKQYNKELQKSERDIKNGHFISQKDLEKEAEKW